MIPFALTVITYGLSVSILNDTNTSASIALSQFEGDGVSLSGIFIGLIVLGAIQFFILISPCVLMNFLFNLIFEALFFKFASCFNFPSNAIVVARSSLVILHMIILLCFALYVIIELYKESEAKIDKFNAFLAVSLILPSLVILILNAVLIAQLKPQLNYFIQPSSLRMGFFNTTEISQIQNGTYVKTDTFEQQIIGNLGDVIFSSTIVRDGRTCDKDVDEEVYSNEDEDHEDCAYIKTYSYRIPCTYQSALFYKDCAYESSLEIYVSFSDSGSYPSYNCIAYHHRCNQLLSNYTLILIQEIIPNQVQVAWAGFSNCYTNIKFELTYDPSLYPEAPENFS